MGQILLLGYWCLHKVFIVLSLHAIIANGTNLDNNFFSTVRILLIILTFSLIFSFRFLCENSPYIHYHLAKVPQIVIEM